MGHSQEEKIEQQGLPEKADRKFHLEGFGFRKRIALFFVIYVIFFLIYIISYMCCSNIGITIENLSNSIANVTFVPFFNLLAAIVPSTTISALLAAGSGFFVKPFIEVIAADFIIAFLLSWIIIAISIFSRSRDDYKRRQTNIRLVDAPES